MRKRTVYKGQMPWADFIRQEETPDLFDTVTDNAPSVTPNVTAKMLNLATDVLLMKSAEHDGDTVEQLKYACARAGVLYDGATVNEALRRARGRVRK